MKKLIYLFACLVFGGALLSSSPVQATHLMGSDIQWICKGHDSFLVTITIYRDCNGISLADQDFTVTDCNKKSISLNTTAKKILVKDITPVCKKSCTRCGKTANQYQGNPNCKFPYGIEKFVFQQWIILPAYPKKNKCCTFMFSWTNCCRNDAITTGGASNGFYVEGSVDRCRKPCDNSPRFLNPPVAIVCQNACVTFNPGVVDDDVDAQGNADSLVYSFDKPTTTDSKSYTTWSTPYSYDKPLKFDSFPKKDALWNPPSCAGFHLDASNGDIQFKPTKVEQTIVSIRVDEYAKDTNGTVYKKGYTHRDVQLIVVKCPNNKVPTLTGIDGSNYNDAYICAGHKLCFTINSNDVDQNDTVSVSWNNALGALGATFITEKKKQHPRSTFCWTPTFAQARTYPYQFVVSAQDDACPVPGTTQRSFRIHVLPAPEGTVKAVYNGCGDYTFTLIPKAGSKYDGSTIVWSGDDGLGGSGLTTKHHYRLASKNTTDSIHYQVSFGRKYSSPLGNGTCPTIINGAVYIPPYVQVTLPHDSTICKAFSPTILIKSKVTGGKNPYVFKWSTGDTTQVITQTITKNTTVYLKVTDNNGAGCSNADTFHIKALVPTKPDLGTAQRHCAGEDVILQDNSFHDSMGYHWYNAATPGKSLSDSNTALVKDSGIYVLRLNDNKLVSCYSYDSVTIDFNQPVAIIPQTIQACANTSITLDAGNGKGDLSANWQWRDLYNHARVLYKGRRVTLIPKQDMHFFVTSSQMYKGVSCQDSGTIHVYVNPLPPNKTSAIPDQCINNPPLDLSIYTTTPGGIWTADTATPANALKKGKFYLDTAGVGKHTLTYTTTDNTSGCTNPQSHSFKIDTIPLVLLHNDTFQCIDATQPFDLSTLLYGPTGGTWTGPAVTKNRYFNQADPQAGGDGIKKFTYSVIDRVKASHCPASKSVNINVLRALKANGGPDLDACRKYSASPIQLPVTIDASYNPRWIIADNTTPDSSIKPLNGGYYFYPEIADTGVHKLVFEVSHSGYRCPNRDTVLFTVHANPNVTITKVPSLCVKDVAYKLDGNPKGGTFNLLNGNASALSSPYFFPAKAGRGSYRLKYTYYNKNQCFDSASIIVVVDDTPSVYLNPPPPACAGIGQIKLSATKSANVKTISWVKSDPTGKFIFDKTDPLIATYVIGKDTSFDITVLSYGNNGACDPASSTQHIDLYPNPVPRFVANQFAGCSPLKINFTDRSSVAGGTPVSWHWDFGDGTTSDDANPIHTYTKDTTQRYSISLSVISNNNCKAFYSLKDYIQVYATPQPWFEAIPTYTTITAPDINFTDLSTINDVELGPNGDKLVHRWDFGDGTVSDTKNRYLTHSYSDTGFYTVKLYVRNPKFNCEAETTRVNYIDIRPELIVFIPNAFTPNHLFNERTITNEKFSPVISNFSAYHMQIFSRWGELLYDTRDITQGWDGTYKGNLVQEGVYIYKVEASSLEGKKFKYSGSVTLLK